MKTGCLGIFFALLLALPQLALAREAESGADLLGARQTKGMAPQLEAALATSGPGFLGADLALAFLFEPFPGRGLVAGARGGVLVGKSDNGSRFHLNLGLEGTFWLANAIGPGLAVDLVAVSREGGVAAEPHFRVEPYLSTRLMRVGETGALALRVGVPFDTEYHWGFKGGVTFQLGGVPNVGQAAETTQ